MADGYEIAKDIADGLKTTHTVTSGAATAIKNGEAILGKVSAPLLEKAAPTLAKITPYAEDFNKVAGKVAIPVALVAGVTMATYQFAHGKDLEGTKTLGATGGAIGGAIAGAEIGGAIGSIVPGVGTAIGAGVGGVIGGFAGSAAGKYVGGWIHDEVVSVKNAFNDAVTGKTMTAQMAAQANLNAQISQNQQTAPATPTRR